MHTTHTLTILTVASLVVLAPVAGIGVVAAATDDVQVVAPATDAAFGPDRVIKTRLGNPLPETTTHGTDSTPSFIVRTDNVSTLETWANQSDEREVLTTHNRSDTAVVVAPAADVGLAGVTGLLGNGLASESWVERVSYQRAASTPDTVDMVNESAYNAGISTLEQWTASGEYSPAGVIYNDDADPATLQDSRNVTHSDDVSATGDNVTVAVIDTGINTAGGEVFGNGTAGSELRISNQSKNFISNETVENSSNEYDVLEDGNGHGTHVASTIAANHSNDSFDGFAPDADLLVLKALNDEGSGSTGNIAAAIRYAADKDADVVSMSLGAPVYDAALDDAVDYALRNGVTSVVIAAGTSRQTIRWTASPSDTPAEGVVTVAAANAAPPGNDSAAGVGYFSQLGHDAGTGDFSGGVTSGSEITTSAPGIKLKAKTPTTDGIIRTTQLTGTSMATPGVAGGIAQALEANPSWTNSSTEVAGYVENTSRPMPGAAVAEAGGGMLAVDKLVNENTTGDQSDAMTTAAESRETMWTSLSEGTGQTLAGLLAGSVWLPTVGVAT